ncbi:MAG: bifunctional UDP-N-acetylglucosamine diphosphorylase/glucosamine-1-phosphate N-acetyltransferase GlmU [Clostridium sp.]|jgi:bifunctional UDP-N-acetylglucosamine pyrophosphorylase/glucosamine-1-phosphate N-acetyltransferase|uniref:bifunctional UDP-N-acetylglucosamine diphosphorylase/glucosamine-1-phosphate N-acetyltransferase GlmU n=1 Tax=Clostridium sp. TaxID=1506 RepID=UPI0025B83649|nr:bifunctional UDP-N-acetylglucosamine diphosphorylase/glucosamine-1-phosphate N-acetyltransferase GlmU [Clostridium sp.]MCH3965611.1 bifunctional UDP-N-acetylglucosamine diphosphorylase/glucosamine-1-phosphate N-acetyltransferase GlmU [Clostridium sp.]MCI1717120.1 bifunctional UDP-N-acetylglucosamine diphosphorylase/glucosamine-1-phosphate N-acetyltransferase GlmU [Clostridium sp.]MCI1801475.1 bifunctional UDP-N-acetylglucosamine diphosphorylase/glucosamine-1-phosphate N-acetyltransferase GlmU
MYNCAIILAAGEGKRMKSSTPKVLHKICGREMVNIVIDEVRKAQIDDIDVVVGKGADEVKEAVKSRNVEFSVQHKQLGTGHAVICAKSFLKDKRGTVAIFTGDAPLIRESTVKKLVDFQNDGGYSAVVLTSIVEDPYGYGRIIREKNGDVLKIIEHKDCSEEELKVNEINSSMYCFDIESLVESLDKIDNNNAQGEYYLTDVIEILKKSGKKIGALPVQFDETLGVNSRKQLSQAARIMRKRINDKHMENGVTIIDPDSTYIDIDVKIENDTIIYPQNVIEGNTVVGRNCILYPGSRIENSIIEEGVTIQSSVILESSVGKGTTVGPFAYIRPESKIGNSVRIGDFVEVKKSFIGDGTKVSHLTYIGDAEVGKKCNFGCGTVVVNYDGKKKNKTLIGDNSFIGCNTNLVSPVRVDDNTYIAAGSTITDEVPEGSLAIARARQVNKEGWVYKRGMNKKD